MSNKTTKIVETAHSLGASDLSIFSLLLQADMVVKIVVLILVLSSFWCWAVIFDKFIFFRRSDGRIKNFERLYRSSRVLDALYDKVSKSTDNPLASMFVAGMYDLRTKYSKISKPSLETYNFTKEGIYNSVQRTKNIALDRMEKDMILLATVGSSAPFIGLFGTVWGIVNSFKAIAVAKNTSLAVVAPGIAEALLVTAFGLFAAIPAVVFYNVFNNRIRIYAGKMEDFALELSTMLANQIYKDK